MGDSRSLWAHTRSVQTLLGAGCALLGSQLSSQQLECSQQGLDAQMLLHSCSQQWLCEPGQGVGPSLPSAPSGTAVSTAKSCLTQLWASLPSLQPSNPSICTHEAQNHKSWEPCVSAISVSPPLMPPGTHLPWHFHPSAGGQWSLVPLVRGFPAWAVCCFDFFWLFFPPG